MQKLLFIYDIENEDYWKDGLWAAVEKLKNDFTVTTLNVHTDEANHLVEYFTFDFALAWGGFGSPPELFLRNLPESYAKKKGLCLGGYAPPPTNIILPYDIIFYETNWSMDWMHQNRVPAQTYSRCRFRRAFGVNKDIYFPRRDPAPVKLWDYLTVGAFSVWKRQTLLVAKPGHKMAVGQIQKDNLGESIDVIGNLLLGHCAVSDMVHPDQLALMYNMSRRVYIPAELMGGGERAVLEAKACDIAVEVEPDNPKLLELANLPHVWSHEDYAKELKEGILACLS